MARWAGRLTVAASTLLLGAIGALATVALHDYWWGLVLGLVATAATLVALPGGWARLPFGIGWSGLVAAAAVPRAEGDVVIAWDRPGQLLLAAAVVVIIVAMVGARRDRPVAPPGTGDPADR